MLVLIYLPQDTNIWGSRSGEFEWIGLV